ncbi:glycosyltransferase [Clostridium perfringens]
MDVLYISRACPQKKYDELKYKPSQAAVKFNRLVVEGLAYNGFNIHCAFIDEKNLTVNCNKQILKYIDYNIKNITYYIKRNINNKFLKGIISCFNTVKLFNHILNKKDSVLICDYLCLTNSLFALIISKFKKRKSIAIVTDLPDFLVGPTNKDKNKFKEKFYESVAYFVLNKFDYYVLLTEQMKEKLKKNISNDKYIIMEGLIDINSIDLINDIDKKDKIKKCIYAGSLHKEYGIDLLINAFHKLKLKDISLHIYGDGNYKKEVEKICELDKRIKYFGQVSNEVILKEQITATLLINPRTSKGEFTKYSFPSKNLECMASGTPLLGCILPGMPEEYIKYMYVIKEEDNLEYLTENLNHILSIDKEELYEKGNHAKKFVIKNKNNKIQAKKIIDMILL